MSGTPPASPPFAGVSLPDISYLRNTDIIVLRRHARKKKSRVWHFFSLPGKLKGTRDDRNTRVRPKQSTRYELRGTKEEQGDFSSTISDFDLQSEIKGSTGSEK